MPPKSKRSTPATAVAKRAARKVAAKSSGGVDVVPDEIRVSDSDNVVDDSDNHRNNNSSSGDLIVTPKSVDNGSVQLKKEDEVKENEYEKGEHLDLEDNEPEYEPEEYGADNDDKEADEEDLQEEWYEEVEEVEEGYEVEEEEEGDMVGEDMEDVPEEYEGDEDERIEASDGHDLEEELNEEHDHETDHEHANTAEEHEHHEVVKERRKRKEFEVFVGGLDKDATEEDLKEVFSAIGEVTEVRLMMNPHTKKNKGFAFLRFATVEQAKRAVTELRNPVVKGKQCGVTPSQDSDTLFLGNICKTWTKEKLKEKLKSYGIDNIEDLTLVEDSNNEGMNRGFAFLEFPSRSEAMDVFKRLQKKKVLLGVDKPAKVSFSDSFVNPGDEIMAQVTTVFIDGLHASWEEDHVSNLLKKFGKVEKIELARNMPSARRKDFGFVTFDSHGAAMTCAKSINNTELGEGDLKAKVRARLSRPLERGKGKSNSRANIRVGRAPRQRPRAPWNRPPPPHLHARARGFGSHMPVASYRGLKRPIEQRDRRPLPPLPTRARPAPPPPKSYARRAPAPASSRSSLKRETFRREKHPSRSRAVVDYATRLLPERRPSYGDEYIARELVYSDVHRSSASRSVETARRPYSDDGYSQRYEKPPSSYREGRPRDYDSVSGSKRPYADLDEAPPSRYNDSGHGVRRSRARLDYDMPGSASQYGDTHDERLGRSTVGYGSSSRSSLSAQDSHGLYSSRQGASYSGSYGGSDGMYSSIYGDDYGSRGSDVGGGSSYSSLYSTRGASGSSYVGGSSSGRGPSGSSYMGGGSSGRGAGGSSYVGGGSSGRGASGGSYMGSGGSNSYY